MLCTAVVQCPEILCVAGQALVVHIVGNNFNIYRCFWFTGYLCVLKWLFRVCDCGGPRNPVRSSVTYGRMHGIRFLFLMLLVCRVAIDFAIVYTGSPFLICK